MKRPLFHFSTNGPPCWLKKRMENYLILEPKFARSTPFDIKTLVRTNSTSEFILGAYLGLGDCSHLAGELGLSCLCRVILQNPALSPITLPFSSSERSGSSDNLDKDPDKLLSSAFLTNQRNQNQWHNTAPKWTEFQSLLHTCESHILLPAESPILSVATQNNESRYSIVSSRILINFTVNIGTVKRDRKCSRFEWACFSRLA